MIARVVLVQLAAVALACALVTAYHVESKTAAMSGKARPDLGVSEVITCNFDELDSASGAYVEFFVGNLGANPANQFKVDVYEYPDGVLPIASHSGKAAQREHTWLKLPLTVASGYSFTKGKQYEFRFTRSGSDSIQFYYQGGNPALYDPYHWGWMRVGGTEEVCMDLCAWAHGHPKVGGQAP